MGSFQVRTDLALEARESISEADSTLRGVIVEEDYDEEADVRVTRVEITTKNAAKALGKPMGVYITIEAPGMLEPDEDYHREISQVIAKQLTEIIPDAEEEQAILVVGLGNREVTADALGPHVVDNLFVTRHIVREFGKAAYNKKKMNMVSCMEPGVTGKTGMEAAEMIKGVIEQTKPTVMIVIDALAARSTRRLNRTVQISNTGIHPGSGVGNNRNALTEESMGIPVISIGVPTVVDAATIVGDALEKMYQNVKSGDKKWQLEAGQNTLPELHNMYVASKDIDAVIKRLSYTVSEGINMALELE
ncbi:MAG: GPR endopeptidase [Lachnospiraceae bacterium]|nr:GPR endopeptidase [Lachnospiraceae bacterium]